MSKVILSEIDIARAGTRVSELARDILADDENDLDNVLEIYFIGRKLLGEVWGTEFHVFGVIASDTDHLPTSKVRPLCSHSMLEKSDEELRRVIEFYKSEVTDACHQILSKYQPI